MNYNLIKELFLIDARIRRTLNGKKEDVIEDINNRAFITKEFYEEMVDAYNYLQFAKKCEEDWLLVWLYKVTQKIIICITIIVIIWAKKRSKNRKV